MVRNDHMVEAVVEQSLGMLDALALWKWRTLWDNETHSGHCQFFMKIKVRIRRKHKASCCCVECCVDATIAINPTMTREQAQKLVRS